MNPPPINKSGIFKVLRFEPVKRWWW